jgi:hypothetical protein
MAGHSVGRFAQAESVVSTARLVSVRTTSRTERRSLTCGLLASKPKP